MSGDAIVGVVGDTHGLLRTEAVRVLCGVDVIVHAGDVGDPGVLDALRAVAPVHAVRGNRDRGRWADALPESAVVEVAGRLLYVVHDPGDVDLDPGAAGIDVVITGHTHVPRIEHRRGVLFMNPGSAGPRRAGLPVAVALLRISAGGIEPRLVHLAPIDEPA